MQTLDVAFSLNEVRMPLPMYFRQSAHRWTLDPGVCKVEANQVGSLRLINVLEYPSSYVLAILFKLSGCFAALCSARPLSWVVHPTVTAEPFSLEITCSFCRPRWNGQNALRRTGAHFTPLNCELGLLGSLLARLTPHASEWQPFRVTSKRVHPKEP